MIVETFLLSGTNADVLKAPSRLAAIPKDGVLTIEASADKCDGTNNGQLTIRDAEGDVPIRNCHIPANGMGDGSTSVPGVLHGSTEWVIAVPVQQGQHVQVDYEETGTVVAILRATLKP